MKYSNARFIVFLWVALSLGSSVCHAQNVIVRIWRSGAPGCECGGFAEPPCFIEETHPAGSDIDITVFPCVSHVNISSGPDIIVDAGHITIQTGPY